MLGRLLDSNRELVATGRSLKEPGAEEVLQFWGWGTTLAHGVIHEHLYSPEKHSLNLIYFPDNHVERRTTMHYFASPY